MMTTECSVAGVPKEERKEQTFSPASAGAIAFLPLQNTYCTPPLSSRGCMMTHAPRPLVLVA